MSSLTYQRMWSGNVGRRSERPFFVAGCEINKNKVEEKEIV